MKLPPIPDTVAAPRTTMGRHRSVVDSPMKKQHTNVDAEGGTSMPPPWGNSGTSQDRSISVDDDDDDDGEVCKGVNTLTKRPSQHERLGAKSGDNNNTSSNGSSSRSLAQGSSKLRPSASRPTTTTTTCSSGEMPACLTLGQHEATPATAGPAALAAALFPPKASSTPTMGILKRCHRRYSSEVALNTPNGSLFTVSPIRPPKKPRLSFNDRYTLALYQHGVNLNGIRVNGGHVAHRKCQVVMETMLPEDVLDQFARDPKLNGTQRAEVHVIPLEQQCVNVARSDHDGGVRVGQLSGQRIVETDASTRATTCPAHDTAPLVRSCADPLATLPSRRRHAVSAKRQRGVIRTGNDGRCYRPPSDTRSEPSAILKGHSPLTDDGGNKHTVPLAAVQTSLSNHHHRIQQDPHKPSDKLHRQQKNSCTSGVLTTAKCRPLSLNGEHKQGDDGGDHKARPDFKGFDLVSSDQLLSKNPFKSATECRLGGGIKNGIDKSTSTIQKHLHCAHQDRSHVSKDVPCTDEPIRNGASQSTKRTSSSSSSSNSNSKASKVIYGSSNSSIGDNNLYGARAIDSRRSTPVEKTRNCQIQTKLNQTKANGKDERRSTSGNDSSNINTKASSSGSTREMLECLVSRSPQVQLVDVLKEQGLRTSMKSSYTAKEAKHKDGPYRPQTQPRRSKLAQKYWEEFKLKDVVISIPRLPL